MAMSSRFWFSALDPKRGFSHARTLHHVGLLTCFCLMSGIPWISHYDLVLFATAPLLYMSFQSMKCLESLDRWVGNGGEFQFGYPNCLINILNLPQKPGFEIVKSFFFPHTFGTIKIRGWWFLRSLSWIWSLLDIDHRFCVTVPSGYD